MKTAPAKLDTHGSRKIYKYLGACLSRGLIAFTLTVSRWREERESLEKLNLKANAHINPQRDFAIAQAAADTLSLIDTRQLSEVLAQSGGDRVDVEFERLLTETTGHLGYSIKVSDDLGTLRAFTISIDGQATIYLNRALTKRRAFQSTFHEVGHFRLGHKSQLHRMLGSKKLTAKEKQANTKKEAEANRFAWHCYQKVMAINAANSRSMVNDSRAAPAA